METGNEIIAQRTIRVNYMNHLHELLLTLKKHKTIKNALMLVATTTLRTGIEHTVCIDHAPPSKSEQLILFNGVDIEMATELIEFMYSKDTAKH